MSKQKLTDEELADFLNDLADRIDVTSNQLRYLAKDIKMDDISATLALHVWCFGINLADVIVDCGPQLRREIASRVWPNLRQSAITKKAKKMFRKP